LKTNFGFVLKFHNSGANLNGNLDILIHKTVAGLVHTYQVKSTALTSLDVNLRSNTALIISKAILTDITNPSVPVLVANNLKLQVNLTDRSNSGNNDQIGIGLWNGTTLLFSSYWNGSSTEQRQLGDGNVIIESNSSFGTILSSSKSAPMDTAVVETPKANLLAVDFNVKAYPNPFAEVAYFDFKVETEAKVTLEIFTINGTKVATLYDNVATASNNYRLEYIPKNSVSGVLIYRFVINGKVAATGQLIQTAFH